PGPEWQALTTSAGVLIVLWLVPGGLADIVYRVRDAWLRWLAQRRGIVVPSLVADRRADPPADPLAMIVAAPVEAAASSASTEPGAPTDPVVPTAPGVRAP
ncbi:MAG TPA: hypothetical protein VNY84_15730, partial [Acidimicrobiales bacterium]|nr:hypothetical protein [Acidimicrobiales bacterium]